MAFTGLVARHAPVCPEDPVQLGGCGLQAELDELAFGVRRGNAGERPCLGIGQLTAGERRPDDRKCRKCATDPYMFARSAEPRVTSSSRRSRGIRAARSIVSRPGSDNPDADTRVGTSDTATVTSPAAPDSCPAPRISNMCSILGRWCDTHVGAVPGSASVVRRFRGTVAVRSSGAGLLDARVCLVSRHTTGIHKFT